MDASPSPGEEKIPPLHGNRLCFAATTFHTDWCFFVKWSAFLPFPKKDIINLESGIFWGQEPRQSAPPFVFWKLFHFF